MKLFRRTYGFWDQAMRFCPPIKDLGITIPKKGPVRVKLTAGGAAAQGAPESSLHVTLGAGARCTNGSMTLRRKTKSRAVYP